jgi:phosphatidylglycerophosphate synthase
LLKVGLKPNQVSVLSVVFAGGAAACLMAGVPHPLAWFGAALCIQMRLLCNLMDGMLAVEGGLKSPSGDLYNEFPDRLADTLILAGAGIAGGTALSETLGWLAACGALMTACVRMHGASLTGAHDFRGPMAKPHRMALATGLCLVMALGSMLGWEMRGWVEGALCVMVAGIAVTLWRRLSGLSRTLHERAGGEGK